MSLNFKMRGFKITMRGFSVIFIFKGIMTGFSINHKIFYLIDSSSVILFTIYFDRIVLLMIITTTTANKIRYLY